MISFIRKRIQSIFTNKPLLIMCLGLCILTLILGTPSKSITFSLVCLTGIFAYVLGRNAQNSDEATKTTSHKNTSHKNTSDDNNVSKHFASVINAISDPLIILNDRALIQYANTSAKTKLLNCREHNPFSFCLRDPAVLEAVEKAIQSGTSRSVQYTERAPVERFYELMISAIESSNEHKNTVILMRDITRLQLMENTRADFVANASHELRTPLASLIGFIETLQGAAKHDPKAQDAFLKIMGEQARRMSRLVDDLLSLSRIELTEHVPPKDHIDIVSVVRLIIDTLKGLAHERGVDITLQSLDHLCLVLGDRDELLRVFENLIENAVKYGQSGKRIDVTIAKRTEADCVDISIKDYGEGIEPQHIPRLTERFYRADIDSSRQQGGTGLGLAIVKHIITRHQGTLRIESTKGQGAKFTISIPVLK